MIILGLIIMAGTGLIINNNLEELGHKSFKHQAEVRSKQLQSEISSYIQQRLNILRDFTKIRAFSQAVLQPETSAEEAQGLMDSWQLLGKKYPLFLLDFEGRIIRQSNAKGSTFILNPSVKSILKGKVDESIDLIKQSPTPRVRLTVSIKNNSYTEGTLVTEIPMAEVFAELSSLVAHNEGLQVFHDDYELTYIGENIKNSHEEKIELGRGFWANIYFDYAPFLTMRKQALYRYLLIAFVVSVLVSSLGIYLFNRFMVQPLRSLENHFSRCELKKTATQEDNLTVTEFYNLQILFDQLVNALQERHSQLEGVNTEMEKLVQERTEELTDKIQELQEMSQYKSRFFANMSHEIRTPMNAIHGYAELLQDLKLKGKAGDYSEIIYKSTKSLLAIINDVLDFSKILAGKTELNMRVFNFNDLLKNLEDLFQRSCDAKNIILKIQNLPDKNVWVRADKDRIRQIMINLISNAIKFTSNGQVEVLSTLKYSDKKAKIHLKVKDTGRGISSEGLSKIFKPFEQADLDNKSHEGTGLGLPICQDLLQLMNSELDVKSKLGQGSCFSFDLELERIVQPQRETTDVKDFTKLNFTPKILVVDDNHINLELVKDCLKGLPVQCHLSSSGKEAIDFTQNTVPDLILMDCQMPQMDGFEATNQLRKMGLKVPIIAFSANAFQENIDHCRQVGMDDYIIKPFEKNNFLTKIHQWLDSHPNNHRNSG